MLLPQLASLVRYHLQDTITTPLPKLHSSNTGSPKKSTWAWQSDPWKNTSHIWVHLYLRYPGLTVQGRLAQAGSGFAARKPARFV
jgi:hypothetical protein